MIKIAICDDEEKAVALHKEIVMDCLQACGIGYEITTYVKTAICFLIYPTTDFSMI